MAEDQVDRRKDYLKELAPWTKLFSAFKVALDPKKLMLAGCGMLVMSLGWYVLSVVFFSTSSKEPPKWNSTNYPDIASEDPVKRNAAWQEFKRDGHQWYLLYEMAGTPPLVEKDQDGKKVWVPDYVVEDGADLANGPDELGKPRKTPETPRALRYKPYGKLRILPWFEDRGPNPFLLVTGGVQGAEGNLKFTDWVDWLVRTQLPVVLEPLFKFFQPIVYFFDPAAGLKNRLYLLLVILWTLATWALFGGAITRIAAVQIARPNERVSLNEALKFVWTRYKAYLTAPIFPLLFLAALTVVLVVFGLGEGNLWILGDILGPLLWPLALLVGLIMAVVLVGLVGWPLMYTTISAEGSDSFDAISRSYSYVYQAPWHYLWYSVLAIFYGALLVFFVGFMGSLSVYAAKWAITLAQRRRIGSPLTCFVGRPRPSAGGICCFTRVPTPRRGTRSTVAVSRTR